LERASTGRWRSHGGIPDTCLQTSVWYRVTRAFLGSAREFPARSPKRGGGGGIACEMSLESARAPRLPAGVTSAGGSLHLRPTGHAPGRRGCLVPMPEGALQERERHRANDPDPQAEGVADHLEAERPGLM